MHRLAVVDVGQARDAGDAQREGGVVAGRAGEEELGGAEAGQHEIVGGFARGVWCLLRMSGARFAETVDVEGQQHRHRALGDAGKARLGGGIERGESLAPGVARRRVALPRPPASRRSAASAGGSSMPPCAGTCPALVAPVGRAAAPANNTARVATMARFKTASFVLPRRPRFDRTLEPEIKGIGMRRTRPAHPCSGRGPAGW